MAVNKIRKYVETFFQDIPKTKKVIDTQEELIADLKEKYTDLINSGISDEEAYQEVIAGLGDMDELVEGLKRDYDIGGIEKEIIKKQKQTALVVSVSVGLYILSIVAICIVEELGKPEYVSVSTFFTIAGFATCLLIYHFLSIPKISHLQSQKHIRNKRNESIELNNKNSDKLIRDTISSILWLMIVCIYFIISFTFRCWNVSWILFLIGACIQNIIYLILNLRDKKQ